MSCFSHAQSGSNTLAIESDLGTKNIPPPGGAAYRAFSITHQDTVIETANGYRLPGVPMSEAKKLNALRRVAEGAEGSLSPSPSPISYKRDAGSTNIEMAPAFTDPLFPPLPVYGPATPLRRLQCLVFRAVSGILSLCFLAVVVMGAVVESVPELVGRRLKRIRGVDPDSRRPFIEVEREREKARKAAKEKDELRCDIDYYARKVGLDSEVYTVETEDGFLLELHHVFDPHDPPYYPESTEKREDDGRVTTIPRETERRKNGKPGRRRYPVLLIHGLLQSAGAYCVNDADSLAFYLVRW
jgi:hypothetical protein